MSTASTLSTFLHERLITSARAANAPLYDSIAAHFQSAGLRPDFVYETLQAQAGTTLIEQGLGVVTGAINLFTSLPQTIKYRFINDMEPMSVQMFSRLKERDSLIFDFVEMVTEEACRWRALNLQPGASRDKYAVRFTCRID